MIRISILTIIIFFISFSFNKPLSITLASNIKGVTYKEIAECYIKSCFINILIIYKSEILKQHKFKDGTFYEIYKIKRNTDISLDKYVKAIISTVDAELWNVTTSPIEGFVSNDEYIIIKSTYNAKEESIKIEIQLTSKRSEH